MCLPAVRSGATRKRTGAVARVGGAATGADGRLACGWDDKRSSASSPASDGRFACSSDSPPEHAS